MFQRFVIFILVGVLLFPTLTQAAIPSPASLSGYAWSENIGWISMRGSNYGVQIQTSLNIEGYAWSSNLGWIRFGGLTGCPGGGNCNARVDTATNQVLGWARVCSAAVNADCTGGTNSNSGGWSGWVSLNCINTGACSTSNYNVTISNGTLAGFAWSDQVLGWLSFSGSNYAVVYPVPCALSTVCTANLSGRTTTDQWCTVGNFSCNSGYQCNPSNPKSCVVSVISASLSVAPRVVREGGTVNMTWSATNASGCTLQQTNPGGSLHGSWTGTSGNQVTSNPIAGLIVFTLECTTITGAVVQEVASTTVNIVPQLIER